MSGITEIDAGEAPGRDRDGADRGVVVLTLEAGEDRLHVGDGNETVVTTKSLGDPPPKVDARPVDCPVRFDMAVRRDVIDGDLERHFFGLDRGRKHEQRDNRPETLNQAEGDREQAGRTEGHRQAFAHAKIARR